MDYKNCPECGQRTIQEAKNCPICKSVFPMNPEIVFTSNSANKILYWSYGFVSGITLGILLMLAS